MFRIKRSLTPPVLLALSLVFWVGMSGCGRENKTQLKPDLGQKALEQRTGKAGNVAWSIDNENYFVKGTEKHILLVQGAGAEGAMAKEMNGRLLAYSPSMATAWPVKDNKDPVYLQVSPHSILQDQGKSSMTLQLLLQWDLSAYSGKEGAPARNWDLTWGGLPEELPSFTGKTKFKLYNIDDGKVSELPGALGTPKVTAKPGGEGFTVDIGLVKRGFPSARKLVGVVLLEFAGTDGWMMDTALFADLKTPGGAKGLVPETALVGGIMFGPVAHSQRVFGHNGDGVFYPDLTGNTILLTRYRAWLKARYGTIETLNDYTEGGHSDFEKVAWRVNTLPSLDSLDKPETYKEWKTYSEAERTMRVQADFLKELRAKNVNRALVWLKEKHPELPVWLALPAEVEANFVERAGTAGDGIVFQLRQQDDFYPTKPKYANLNENTKTRSGSTKFLGALLGPQAAAALVSSSVAVSLAESGFRGLFFQAGSPPPPKTLEEFEETVRKTVVAKAIQGEPPESDQKKADDSLAAKEGKEPPADFKAPAPVSPSVGVSPSAAVIPRRVPPPVSGSPPLSPTGDRPNWMGGPAGGGAAPSPAAPVSPSAVPNRPAPPVVPVNPSPTPPKAPPPLRPSEDEFSL